MLPSQNVFTGQAFSPVFIGLLTSDITDSENVEEQKTLQINIFQLLKLLSFDNSGLLLHVLNIKLYNIPELGAPIIVSASKDHLEFRTCYNGIRLKFLCRMKKNTFDYLKGWTFVKHIYLHLHHNFLDRVSSDVDAFAENTSSALNFIRYYNQYTFPITFPNHVLMQAFFHFINLYMYASEGMTRHFDQHIIVMDDPNPWLWLGDF